MKWWAISEHPLTSAPLSEPVSEPVSEPLVSLPVAQRSLADLDELQVAARQYVAATQQALAVSSLVHGDALLLGALQREASVTQRYGLPDIPRVRRLTTGGAARLNGDALHHLLLLPRVDQLMADAQPGNFINRYVRGLLSGYNALGARANYFGREHFTLAKRPAGVLGVDVTSGGVWSLEAWVGLQQSTVLEQFRGAAPVALLGALSATGSAWVDAEPLSLALRVHERACRVWLSGPIAAGVSASSATDADVLGVAAAVSGLPKTPDPEVDGDVEGWRSVEVPIGLLEVGVSAGGHYIRGDILTSSATVASAEAALAGIGSVGAREAERALSAFDEVPFEGARLSDLLGLLVDA